MIEDIAYSVKIHAKIFGRIQGFTVLSAMLCHGEVQLVLMTISQHIDSKSWR